MRRAAVVLLLALAAWCGGVAGAAGVRTCRISQMRLGIGPRVSEKTEQHTMSVLLTNLGATTCTLYGYPTVAFLGDGGVPLPFVYRHGGDQMITSSRPHLIEIKPGANAFFAFNEAQACNARTPPAQTLRVRLPAGQGAQTIRLRRPLITYCQGGRGQSLAVSPIEGHLAGAFCHTAKSC